MVLKAPGAFESIINTTLDSFGLLSSTSSRAGTSLEIRQIEGADPVTVLLRERAMPYQEPSFKTVLKTKKTTYPGNPVATQQVLNPDLDNTTFEGTWKERFLRGAVVINGNEDAVTSVDQVIAIFENLSLSGKLVRVQWLSFVRTGLLVGFDVKPQNAVDMKWELEFEWQSRDDSILGSRAAAFTTPSPDDLLNLLNTIEDIITMAPGVVQSFNAVVVSAVRDISNKLGEIVNLLRVAEAVISMPAQVEGAIQSLVLTLVRQVQDLTRQLSDRWSESFMGKGLALALASSTVQPETLGSQSSALASQASYAAWSRSLTLSLGALSFATQRAYQGVVDRTKPSGLRVVTVAEGETLYSLAQKLYGSPDFANFLAVVNGLTSVRVPPGFQLRAPGRPFGALGQVEMSGGKQSGAAGAL